MARLCRGLLSTTSGGGFHTTSPGRAPPRPSSAGPCSCGHPPANHQHQWLGGNLRNFKISLMVPIEVPIHKYFSGPQNYNPGGNTYTTTGRRRAPAGQTDVRRRRSVSYGYTSRPQMMNHPCGNSARLSERGRSALFWLEPQKCVQSN